jgi:hypothetical protein
VSHELLAQAGLQLPSSRSQPPKQLGLQATIAQLKYIFESGMAVHLCNPNMQEADWESNTNWGYTDCHTHTHTHTLQTDFFSFPFSRLMDLVSGGLTGRE